MVLRVDLSDEEGNRLRMLMKKTRDVVVLRRAMVVMQSAQGYTPPRIGIIDGGHIPEALLDKVAPVVINVGFEGLVAVVEIGRDEAANVIVRVSGDRMLPSLDDLSRSSDPHLIHLSSTPPYMGHPEIAAPGYEPWPPSIPISSRCFLTVSQA